MNVLNVFEKKLFFRSNGRQKDGWMTTFRDLHQTSFCSLSTTQKDVWLVCMWKSVIRNVMSKKHTGLGGVNRFRQVSSSIESKDQRWQLDHFLNGKNWHIVLAMETMSDIGTSRRLTSDIRLCSGLKWKYLVNTMWLVSICGFGVKTKIISPGSARAIKNDVQGMWMLMGAR